MGAENELKDVVVGKILKAEEDSEKAVISAKKDAEKIIRDANATSTIKRPCTT